MTFPGSSGFFFLMSTQCEDTLLGMQDETALLCNVPLLTSFKGNEGAYSYYLHALQYTLVLPWWLWVFSLYINLPFFFCFLDYCP